MGDPNRLRQVLLNLVGNAIKFTDQGEVVVHVRLASAERGQCVLEMTVRDTGIGIAEDRQQQIFSPFVQADSSMTRQYGGTGLGLTISTRLVAMMDGRIWLNSEPGVGSEFHFTARFETVENPAQRREADSRRKSARHASAGGGRQRDQLPHPAAMHWLAGRCVRSPSRASRRPSSRSIRPC